MSTNGSFGSARPDGPQGASPAKPIAEIGDGGIVVDAGAVAPHLGLSPERFMAELRRGLIYQVAEKGIDADAGRIRLTFRYRAREWRVVLSADGCRSHG